MDLFDIIKKIFDRNSKWDAIKTYDKSKNFFMINRFMSINFPMQANMFNNRHIVSSSAVDSWKDVLNRLFTKPPSWMYTKTKKKEGKEEKKIDFSDYEEAESFIMKRFEISKREISDLKKFYPQKYESWIKEISTQLKSIEKD